ncbi:MAG: aminotransferase class IV [Candidatus Thermoplasmatota archaeon]
MSSGIAYVDGSVVDLERAVVPLNDRGYLLGDGIFETLRTSNGKVFRLDEHAARLGEGLAAINLDDSLTSEFRAAVAALVKEGTRHFGGELYVRIMVTTGPMEDVLETGRGVTVTGIAKKFRPYPMQYYANGIHLALSRQRKDSRNPLASVKTLSFLPYVAARRDAHAAMAHDALLLNEHGRIAEASTSNIFALVGGILHAPGASEGAIAGVTRGAVLELAEEAGLEVANVLTLDELASAKEAWLTNTTGGIVPATRLLDRPIGDGKKGELTAQMSHGLEAMIRGQTLVPA